MDDLRSIRKDATRAPWRTEPASSGAVELFDIYSGSDEVVCDATDEDAQFIATFDPQMVGALLNVAEHAAALRLSTPEYVDEAQHRLSEALDALDRLT